MLIVDKVLCEIISYRKYINGSMSMIQSEIYDALDRFGMFGERSAP